MAANPQREARSLSAINYLAANPPQYPYHPEVRESLTLYISRVPGTQDIILSTFRPQKKNVTGEDIANSLYYVHLDLPEDGLLGASQFQERVVSPRSSGESARSAIPRKPLPASAKIQRPENASGAAHSGVSQPVAAPPGAALQGEASGDLAPPHNLLQQPEEGTVEGYRENPMFRKRRSGGTPDIPDQVHTRLGTGGGAIQRKALSPSSPSVPKTGPGGDISVSPDPNAQMRPVTPTQPRTLAPPLGGQVMQITSPGSPLRPDRTPSPGQRGRRPSSVSFSLTIIRRDPTSGTQCNVGKVSSFQTNVPTPDAADPGLDPDNMGGLLAHAQKVGIHIESSGYAKYRDMPSRAEVDAFRPTSGHSFTQQGMQPVTTAAGRERSSSLRPAWGSSDEGFSRQVVMSYGASWSSNFKKAFRRKDRPDSPVHAGSTSPENPAMPRSLHARHDSASTIGSVDSADGSTSPPLITHPGPGLKPKGYVFLSPWNGRCEFRTSTNGRSLKLRHVLDPASAKIDPREVAQSIRDAQAMGRSRGDELTSALLGAKPVSELRFNLPNGAHHQRASERDGVSKSGRWDGNHLSGHLSKLLHHRSRSSDEESDDDEDDYGDDGHNKPMDLSLGKEHAGGGNRGKRAKLGKLIIHDEGLKMLDLVVAANVGVWWTTWGRMM